jgi:Leucine-rich repeat (LRR) protein
MKYSALNLICLVIILYTTEGFSQGKLLTAQQLTEAPWFYDLESANKNPEEVYNLSITWEKLEQFPEAIFKFINLQHLDLMDNEIRNIPPEISKLRNLQILFLSNNKLSSLPEEIMKLENLEILHLERNRFVEIPDWIGTLKKLKKVGLRDNKIPAEVIEKLNEKFSEIEINK